MTIDASVLLGFCKSFTTGLCQKADKRKFHEWTHNSVQCKQIYTSICIRREGMHFVMSLNYCWYIIFVHFHWGWLRLSEFCLFIFMVLGSLTIKILVNQVLFHPTSPWDVGLRRSDHFTPCFYFCCLEQCKTRTWYCDFCHAFYLIGEFPIDQMKQSDWSEQIACRFQANHQPI